MTDLMQAAPAEQGGRGEEGRRVNKHDIVEAMYMCSKQTRQDEKHITPIIPHQHTNTNDHIG